MPPKKSKKAEVEPPIFRVPFLETAKPTAYGQLALELRLAHYKQILDYKPQEQITHSFDPEFISRITEHQQALAKELAARAIAC